MRVTDSTVLHWLAWARNYGEVVSWRRISSRGRKWLIEVRPTTDTGAGSLLMRAGPTEMALTSREALLFALGCACGRLSDPAAKQAEWGWNGDEGDDARTYPATLKRPT